MISIVINTRNSAATLKRCLDSLKKFDEVIILDNYSTDTTLDIVALYPNVQFFQHEFCGLGELRNLATQYATHDWVFIVDSDEVLDHNLTSHILTMNLQRGYVYQIARANYYANYRVYTSSWGNDWVTRIYNRLDTKYSLDSVHESVITTKCKVIKLNYGVIYHFPYNEVSGLINKMQFYSTLYAKQNLARKNPKLWTIPFKALAMFIKSYIIKGGFLQGYEGLTISSYNAMGVFSKYIKLYELRHNVSLALAISLDLEAQEFNQVNLEKIISSINNQSLLPRKLFVFLEKSTFKTESIELLLQEQLLIEYQIVSASSQELDFTIQNLMKDPCKLDYIIYASHDLVTVNHKFMERVRSLIHANKRPANYKVYKNNFK